MTDRNVTLLSKTDTILGLPTQGGPCKDYDYDCLSMTDDEAGWCWAGRPVFIENKKCGFMLGKQKGIVHSFISKENAMMHFRERVLIMSPKQMDRWRKKYSKWRRETGQRRHRKFCKAKKSSSRGGWYGQSR